MTFDSWKLANPHDTAAAIEAQREAERFADELDAAQDALKRILTAITRDPVGELQTVVVDVAVEELHPPNAYADLSIVNIDVDLPESSVALEIARWAEHLAVRAREYAVAMERR